MYVPEHFTVENPVWAHEIMRTHSFATLVSGATAKLTASHLPLLWTDSNQGNGVIQGHMARANPQWQDFTEDAEVMAIFTGHHAYISPNWYISRPAVPTWNYAAVHAYGVARVINDQDTVRTLLKRMVATFDADPDQAWPDDETQEEFVQAMIPNVVAFEIPIARLQAKAKLSQNRPANDRARVVTALQDSNQTEAQALANFMQNQKP